MSQDLNNISRDAVRIIANYLGNGFFSFSSVNRRLRGFFQKEREAALKKVKIFVKNNGCSSFLLTFDGKLYACGENTNDHFGLGDRKEELPRDRKCYEKWTRIGPPDKKVSEVILEDESSVFVRCGNEWFAAGSHPYIQQAQRASREFSPWVEVRGPEPFSILELIPTTSSIFIRSKDNFCYVYNWDENTGEASKNLTSSKIYWKKIGPAGKKIKNWVLCESRVFLQCEEGWYGCGKNKQGELGVGHVSDWVKWIKMGPRRRKVLKLKANDFNTFVYCDDERWYGCGDNDRGQLGLGHTDAQLEWIPVGPENKKNFDVYIQNGRTFVTCSDGLYFCGADDYEKSRWRGFPSRDYLNWFHVDWNNNEILNVIAKEDKVFIECREGWYGYGRGDYGIFGRGFDTYNSWEDVPEKLNCLNQPVFKFVASPSHIFTDCKDGWYFSGRNYEGQNGMNDCEFFRHHWTKIISHGEEIEQAVSTCVINRDCIRNESLALRFRRSLRKLYEPYYISILEHMFNDYVGAILKVGYNFNYEGKYCFFFFLEAWDFNNLYDSHVDELPGLLRSLMGFSPLIFLGDEEFNGGGFPWYLRGSDRQNYPFPTHQVDLLVENYEAICQFLQGYEKMLDDYELEFSEKGNELRVHKQ